MTDRPRWNGLEPGQLIPGRGGDWVTIPPASPAAEQMITVLAEESAAAKRA